MRRVFLGALFLAVPLLAQGPAPGLEGTKAAIKKLDFMTGEWEGSGWHQIGQKRSEFTSKERVRPAAGGTAILVEGNHQASDGTFEALGVISWNESTKSYEFRSHTSEGRAGLSDLKITGERRVEWTFAVPQGQIRYTLDTGDGNRWVEVGEFSRDGKEWRKFFEMSLKRIK